MTLIDDVRSHQPDHVVRVLVVDDNEPSALSLSWAMELYGYEVRTCYDGASAVTEADAFDPDIVLMDLGMPEMSGLEACRDSVRTPPIRISW